MARTSHIRIVPALAAFLVAACALLAAVDVADAPAAARGKCAKSNAQPGGATAGELGAAVKCLIAKERKKADLKPVSRNGDLTRVADKHADVMLDRDCLDHKCKGESSLQDRIERSGYPNPGKRYGFAEVTGCSLTPAAMVDAWMESRVHRKRILSRAYSDVGVGATKGTIDVPGCDDGGPRGVYAVVFGWRKG